MENEVKKFGEESIILSAHTENEQFKEGEYLKVNHFGPFTLAEICKDNIVAYGLSKCRFNDTFDSSVGIGIAVKRAKRTLKKKHDSDILTGKFVG